MIELSPNTDKNKQLPCMHAVMLFSQVVEQNGSIFQYSPEDSVRHEGTEKRISKSKENNCKKFNQKYSGNSQRSSQGQPQMHHF